MEEKTNDQKDSRGPSGRQRPDDGAGCGRHLHPSGGGNLVPTASAAETDREPTRTIPLVIDNTMQSQTNTAEGWAWDKDTCTLTLTNCYIRAECPYNIPDNRQILYFKGLDNVTINLIGDNVIECTSPSDFDIYDLRFVIRAEDTLTVTGDGNLDVLGPADADEDYVGIYGDNFILESGSIYCNIGGCFFNGQIDIKSDITIDAAHIHNSQALHANTGNINIFNGTVNLYAGNAGIFITGSGSFASGPQTVNITGGNVNVYVDNGKETGAGISAKYININTNGNLNIFGSTIGINVHADGLLNILQTNDTFSVTNAEDSLYDAVHYGNGAQTGSIIKADYSDLDALLAQVPSDVSTYDEASIAALQQVLAKVDALDRNLNILSQQVINDLVAELRAVLSNLIILPEEPAEGEEEEETYIPSTPISDGLHEYSLGTMLYVDGKRVKGLYEYDGATYYFNSQGFMQTGWVEFDEGWRYFGEDGKMVTGWLQLGNVWYYFDPTTGLMYNNRLATIDKSTYYFYDWGGMASDWWCEAEDGWYFFGGSGAMKAAQWLEWKGDWYYLTETGRMATDTTIGEYYVNADGVWVK